MRLLNSKMKCDATQLEIIKQRNMFLDDETILPLYWCLPHTEISTTTHNHVRIDVYTLH